MQINLSKLKLFSLGIVSENKSLNSKYIEVVPIEQLIFLDGELTSTVDTVSTTGLDQSGNPYNVSLKRSNSIQALWLPLGESNRATAPDVRRGERVLIYSYADTEQYFWVDSGLDTRLRKLETVTTKWSNTRDEDKDADSPDSCWSFEVSTHKKLITLSTNKSDGEPFAYTFQVNAKEGRVTLTDDVGNFFELDSKQTSIKMQNIDGTIVHLNKQNILASAENITINGNQSVNIKSGNTDIMYSPDGTVHKTPKFEGKKS